MKNLRLTVHVANQSKVDTKAPRVTGKPKKTKTAMERAMEPRTKQVEVSSKGRYKLYNTLSFYCKDMEEVHKKLSDVRSKYDIQLGNDRNKKDKYGKELYNVSFVK
jgi:hypothetical protein